MKKLRLVSISLMVLFFAACANNSNQTTNSRSNPIALSMHKNAVSLDNLSDIFPISNDLVLASSETQGLWKLSLDPNVKSQELLMKGEFETLGKVSSQFAVVDAKNNQLTVFSLPPEGLKILHKIKPKNLLLEGFCDYRSLIDNNHYVYLFDGQGWVEQYLVAQAINENDQKKAIWLKKPVFIKSWQGGSEVTSCVTLSSTQSIYITEPTVGVFRYPAEAEGDLKRELIAASQPIGLLPSDATSVVAINPQTLMLVNEETDELFSINLGSYKITQSTPTGIDGAEIEKLHRLNNALVAIDKGNGVVYQWPLLPLSGNTETGLNNKEKSQRKETAVFSVNAAVETPAMSSTGDTADDPAIWVNEKHPHKSRVLATNKKSGLLVYNLKGKLIQELAHGHVNNVDVRKGMSIQGKIFDIAASSNRSNNSISLYRIHPNTGRVVKDIDVPLALAEPYGLCMGKNGKQLTVWVNDKSGLFVEYVLSEFKGKIQAKKSRSFALKSQPEGCFVDDKYHRLFVGEEDEGVWLVDLTQPELTTKPVIKVGESLVADAEGISVAYNGYQGKDVLVISSQGDNSYVLVDANAPFNVLGKFRVTIDAKRGIDGVSETDGLAVSTVNFGGQFNEGILVVQDGYNVMPNQAQNFKFIPWSRIKAGIK